MLGKLRPDLAPGNFPIPGSVFYVSSTHASASDANRGTTPDSPLATVNAAVGKCTANKGDAILMMPGHAETLTVVMTLDVAGISLIGMGVGTNLATITSSASGSIIISADNVMIKNIRLVCGATINTGITAGAFNGWHIDGIVWSDDSDGSFGWANAFVCTTSTDAVIENCTLIGQLGGTMARGIQIGTSTRTRISGNIVSGDAASILVGAGISGSDDVVDVCIDSNFFHNDDGSGRVLDVGNSSTGVIAWNQIHGGLALASNFDPGNCHCIENYVADAIDTHGVIVPTTIST